MSELPPYPEDHIYRRALTACRVELVHLELEQAALRARLEDIALYIDQHERLIVALATVLRIQAPPYTNPNWDPANLTGMYAPKKKTLDGGRKG